MSSTRIEKKPRNINFAWKPASRTVLIALALLSLIFCLYSRKTAHFFPIKNVEIFGIQHVSHAEIQSILTPYVNKSFFSVDVKSIRERILNLPWVMHVSVRRIWPNEVSVVIQEKQPVAQWNDTSLLSANGEIFTPLNKDFPKDLPRLIGPPGKQFSMSEEYVAMEKVVELLHAKIQELDFDAVMGWQIILDNKMVLKLGQKDLLTRLNHFVKVYPKIIGTRENQIDYVDLRYSNGIAVQWKQNSNV